MEPDDTPGHDVEEADDEASQTPSPGVLRAVGELLAAVLTVAAVLAALLIAAWAVQWIFH